MKKSTKIAVCGMCTALSVVLMFVGGLLYVFTYVVPMLMGIVMAMINKTFGRSSALTIYFATTVLSLLLVSEKECVLMYALFFGYYPVIRPYLDKIKSKVGRVVVKFLIFNVAVALVEILSVYVFGIPFFDGETASYWLVIVFAVAMNIIFLMYEYVLKNFLKIYEVKIEPKVKKLFK